MNNIYVTIYITNYNYSKYIEEALNSVFKQTFKNYEVFVFDDGSTDNSVSVIEKLKEKYSFKFFKNSNLGLNATANIALKKANGKYIIRLDADDVLLPHAIGMLFNLMESKNLDLASGDFNLIDYEGDFIKEFRRSKDINQRKIKDIPVHGAVTMIRVKSLRKAGGYFSNIKCQDGYDLWLKLGVNGKYYHLSEPLFNYRQHSYSLSSNPNRILECRYQIKKKYFYKNVSNFTKSYNLVIPFAKGVMNNNLAEKFMKLIHDLKDDNSFIKSFIFIASHQDLKVFEKIKYLDDVIFYCRDDDSYKLKLFNMVKLVFDGETIFNDFSILLDPETKYDPMKLVLESIYTREIFNLSGIVTLKKENRKIYKYDTEGMHDIHGEKKIFWEEDELFRAEPGIYLFDNKLLQNNDNVLGPRIGHVMVGSL